MKRLKWLLFIKAALWILLTISFCGLINHLLPPWLDNRFFAGYMSAIIVMHYKAKAEKLSREPGDK